jgi:hypothetical protein
MLSLPRIIALLFLAASARAESVWLQDVDFAVTHDAGLGNAVFVGGSAPQLGAWDTTRAVRLNWSMNNIWRGRIALPRGVSTTWRPFVRSESTNGFHQLLGQHLALVGRDPHAIRAAARTACGQDHLLRHRLDQSAHPVEPSRHFRVDQHAARARRTRALRSRRGRRSRPSAHLRAK